MQEDKRIAKYVFICYDPYNEKYYLEYRNSWDWCTSVDYYDTEKEAENAYTNGEVKWE